MAHTNDEFVCPTCTICHRIIDIEKPKTEETGGSPQPGLAHSECYWRRVAGIRLDRMEALQEQVQDLRDVIDRLNRSRWDRFWDWVMDKTWGERPL